MLTSGPHPVAFAIRGPITRDVLPGLCDRVCRLLRENGAGVVYCDVRGIEPDAVTVDALARLQLAARRLMRQVRLCHASDELTALVDFMGLTDVLAEPSDEFHARLRSDRATPLPTRRETMASRSRMIFVNLAVEDLDRSVEFFTKLGFTFDPRFTDETATCMVISDTACAMLLTKSKFQEFTRKELADPKAQTEAILALSAASRDEVDSLADTALEAGGSPANDPLDYGFMYGRSFQDPDGHLWEVFWMDPAALEQSPAESGAAA
jgi:hypothetical protein